MTTLSAVLGRWMSLTAQHSHKTDSQYALVGVIAILCSLLTVLYDVIILIMPSGLVNTVLYDVITILMPSGLVNTTDRSPF